MDHHGNIVVRADLRAQNHSRVLVIDDAQLYLIVSIFHKFRSLPVLKIRGERLDSQLLGFCQTDSRAHHVEPPDTDAVRALNAHRFQLRAAGIVSRDNSGADRICRQRNVVCGLNRVVVNRRTVSDRIDTRNAGLLT